MFGRTWLGTEALHTPRVQRGGGTFHVGQSKGHSRAMADAFCYRAVYETGAERSEGPRAIFSYADNGEGCNLVGPFYGDMFPCAGSDRTISM